MSLCWEIIAKKQTIGNNNKANNNNVANVNAIIKQRQWLNHSKNDKDTVPTKRCGNKPVALGLSSYKWPLRLVDYKKSKKKIPWDFVEDTIEHS